jgi:hemerythrin
MFEWTEALSVGVESIDAQHKQLIEMLNDLYASMRSTKGKAELDKILAGLADYAAEHFAAEERLMQQSEFPGYAAHCQIHEDFRAKIATIAAEYAAGKHAVTVELMGFLRNWLLRHIAEQDQQYAMHLQQSGRP